MAEVKWIKLTVGMFDDEKIKLIQSMPEGDAILVIWIRLILLAGKCNCGGYVYFSESIPYTEDMLSTIFNKPLNVIKLAIKTFEHFQMIEIDEKGIYLVNFDKYQNIEGLDKIREQTRIRVNRHRENKQLECNVTGNVTVTQCNATDIDLDKDKEIDIDKRSTTTPGGVPYQEIKDLYNSICVSFPKVRELSDGRKKAINARWTAHGYLSWYTELFGKAESSDFLKGANDRNWKADFDWLMNGNNMVKVIEGKYDNKEVLNGIPKPNPKPGHRSAEADRFNSRELF